MDNIEKMAEEYATGMMGLGPYSEKWDYADKVLFNNLKSAAKHGYTVALRSQPGAVWVKVESEKDLPEGEGDVVCEWGYNGITKTNRIPISYMGWLLKRKYPFRYLSESPGKLPGVEECILWMEQRDIVMQCTTPEFKEFITFCQKPAKQFNHRLRA